MPRRIFTPILYCKDQRDDQKIEFDHEVVITPPRGYIRFHDQDFYELMFFIRGTREIMIGDRVHTYGPGDILILTPHEKHRGRPLGGLTDRYYIHFGIHALDILGEESHELLSIFTDRKPYTKNHLRLKKEDFSCVQKWLADTDHLLKITSNPTANAEALANIIQILALLRRAMNSLRGDNEPNWLLLNIMNYIETNYATIDSIEEVSRKFNISRSNLWRMFKSHVDQSPTEYLRALRLSRSRNILEEGVSVTETALFCGFTDTSHFIRLFREEFGKTPYRYQFDFRKSGERIEESDL